MQMQTAQWRSAPRLTVDPRRVACWACRGRALPRWRAQCATAQTAAGTAPSEASNATCSADEWYLSPVTPPRTVGPIRVAMLEGKGRGVVATRDVAPGDLILAAHPLALATSHLQQRPSGELLVDQVLDRRLYGSAWFRCLYDGSPRSCRGELQLQEQGAPPPPPPQVEVEAAAAVGAPAEEEGQEGSPAAEGGAAAAGAAAMPEWRLPLPPEPLLPAAPTSTSAGSGPAKAAAAPAKKGFLASRGAAKKGAKAGKAAAGKAASTAAAAAGGAADAAGGPDGGGGVLPLPDRREQTRLARVVKFNCFGDDAEDLAACAVRGEAPRGHIGLWPEFSLFNHSCAPNAVNFVVGGAMVVRAVAPIREGQEVTICYLGRPQLLPVTRRLAVLAEDYGFECTCERCTAEQEQYDKVDDVYLEMYEALDERLGPAFLEARQRGDAEGVREVAAEVRAWLGRLYGCFRKTLLAPRYRQYFQASLYDAYDLLLQCGQALGEGPDGSALHEALKAVSAVSPGSDLHVILAVRYADWVAEQPQHGPGSALAAAAAAGVRRAHVARYGPVGGGLMARLEQLNRTLHAVA